MCWPPAGRPQDVGFTCGLRQHGGKEGALPKWEVETAQLNTDRVWPGETDWKKRNIPNTVLGVAHTALPSMQAPRSLSPTPSPPCGQEPYTVNLGPHQTKITHILCLHQRNDLSLNAQLTTCLLHLQVSKKQERQQLRNSTIYHTQQNKEAKV